MADDADVTVDRAEKEAPMLLAASKKAEGPLPKGCCYYCDTKLPSKVARWCDADCRGDWEKEDNLRNRRGIGRKQ